VLGVWGGVMGVGGCGGGWVVWGGVAHNFEN
jgi:hypothetical protein